MTHTEALTKWYSEDNEDWIQLSRQEVGTILRELEILPR